MRRGVLEWPLDHGEAAAEAARAAAEQRLEQRVFPDALQVVWNRCAHDGNVAFDWLARVIQFGPLHQTTLRGVQNAVTRMGRPSWLAIGPPRRRSAGPTNLRTSPRGRAVGG